MLIGSHRDGVYEASSEADENDEVDEEVVGGAVGNQVALQRLLVLVGGSKGSEKQIDEMQRVNDKLLIGGELRHIGIFGDFGFRG